MGAVLSWFTLRLSGLILETAEALKRWRVSTTLYFSLCSSLQNHVSVCVCGMSAFVHD